MCNSRRFAILKRYIALLKAELEAAHCRRRICQRLKAAKSTHRTPPQPPFPHYPSPRTKLASLVKGRWIDGTPQALILLLSACDMPTIFMLQTFLPSRRRDCHTTPRPALTLTIPANNSTQIHRYTTKRLSVKKRATGTFFEDNKAIQNKFRETFYLAKSFPDPSKIRFILRNFAFCGKRFKAPP